MERFKRVEVGLELVTRGSMGQKVSVSMGRMAHHMLYSIASALTKFDTLKHIKDRHRFLTREPLGGILLPLSNFIQDDRINCVHPLNMKRGLGRD